MIWRFLDDLLCRLAGRLLRLSPVDPKPSKRELRHFEKRMADEYQRDINIGRTDSIEDRMSRYGLFVDGVTGRKLTDPKEKR